MQMRKRGFTFHALRITFHVSRFTFHVSRFTLHASRFTFHASRFTFHASRLAPAKHLQQIAALPAAELLHHPAHFAELPDQLVDVLHARTAAARDAPLARRV